MLKALVGDVVIKAQKVEGTKQPEMEARFTINAIPALAALDRGQAGNGVDPTVGMWAFLHAVRWIMLGKAPRGRRDVVVSLHYDRPAAAKLLREPI